MDTMSVLTLLLLAFPEGILTTSLGMTLVGVRPTLKGAIRTGVLFMVCAFIMRRFLPPGIHTIGLTIILFGVLMFVYRLSFKKAAAATVVALLFLALTEAIILTVFISAMSLTIPEVLENPWLRIQASIPTNFCLFIIFYLGYRIRGYHRKADESTTHNA